MGDSFWDAESTEAAKSEWEAFMMTGDFDEAMASYHNHEGAGHIIQVLKCVFECGFRSGQTAKRK